MTRRARRLLLAVAGLAASLVPALAGAQRCVKGKPCGNTCIARTKACHVGRGSAVWAEGVDTTVVIERVPRRARPSTGAVTSPRSAPLAGGRTPCVIARVVDGDTVWCADGPKVRLLLIDAPERDQPPYGHEAAEGLRELLPVGSEAELEFDVQRFDRYRRTLAYVYTADGRMANEEIVRGGYAVASVYPPNVKYVEQIRAAAREAREARRGLWATPAFECLPADHRRGRC